VGEHGPLVLAIWSQAHKQIAKKTVKNLARDDVNDNVRGSFSRVGLYVGSLKLHRKTLLPTPLTISFCYQRTARIESKLRAKFTSFLLLACNYMV
jgi:hypothetical protein